MSLSNMNEVKRNHMSESWEQERNREREVLCGKSLENYPRSNFLPSIHQMYIALIQDFSCQKAVLRANQDLETMTG